MIYEIEMSFSKPPRYSVIVEAANTATAKVLAQHNAIVSGFGKVKKFVSVKEMPDLIDDDGIDPGYDGILGEG